MPRGPRYLPPGSTTEITTRTVCGFYLLPVTSQFARIFVGVLARAQEKNPGFRPRSGQADRLARELLGRPISLHTHQPRA